MTDILPVSIDEFMALSRKYPVIDVRTTAEFQKGHIPGAHNLPLFSNEERAIVGKTYHREGREQAILVGLELVGPKMREMVEHVRTLTAENTLLLYCWRGGMRSNSVGWLFSTYGYRVYVLIGGYKAFRNYALQSFELSRKIIILSGETGSGKTAILQELQKMGEQVIDLEALAHHKGSSFGNLGEAPQPTQQEFENQLALQWRALDASRLVWLEDESQKIGSRMIPQALWQQMRNAPVILLKVPLELRAHHLLSEYGQFAPRELAEAVQRLRERLGGLHTRIALESIEKGDLEGCCKLLLSHYYDKTYRHGLSRRNSELIHTVKTDILDATLNARKVLAAAESLVFSDSAIAGE